MGLASVEQGSDSLQYTATTGSAGHICQLMHGASKGLVARRHSNSISCMISCCTGSGSSEFEWTGPRGV